MFWKRLQCTLVVGNMLLHICTTTIIMHVSHFNLAQLILVQFLSELMAMNEMDMEPRLEEQLGIRETVMRRQLPLTQRERKAGCRNFFWKTFTSC
uniref:Somatostatin/Cortistatin C-terminal domain-containing protein n=1 Tax=Periophthalmus magnuspinnatus TaxID=409849 RepID=A0A3B3ZLM2_9GOBI